MSNKGVARSSADKGKSFPAGTLFFAKANDSKKVPTGFRKIPPGSKKYVPRGITSNVIASTDSQWSVVKRGRVVAEVSSAQGPVNTGDDLEFMMRSTGAKLVVQKPMDAQSVSDGVSDAHVRARSAIASLIKAVSPRTLQRLADAGLVAFPNGAAAAFNNISALADRVAMNAFKSTDRLFARNSALAPFNSAEKTQAQKALVNLQEAVRLRQKRYVGRVVGKSGNAFKIDVDIQ